MTIENFTLAGDALKEYYLPVFQYQLNDEADPFLGRLERDSEHVEGTEAVMAARYGSQGGLGMRADDGALPTAYARQTKQIKWQTKNAFGRMQLTDKVIRASGSDKGAFANLLEQDLSDCLDDAKVDLSRQAQGDGTGALATVTSISSHVITITDTDAIDFFTEGMYLDSFTSGGTLHDTAIQVTAVDDDNLEITVTGDSATVATDLLYRSGNKGLELTGLAAVFANGTSLYGLTIATYPWLKTQQVAINGDFSETLIQKGLDQAVKRAGSKISLLIASYGVVRAYQWLLTAQKRQVNTMELKGGFDALEYNKKPMVGSRFAPSGYLRGLDERDWKLYEMADWDWMDMDGSVLKRISGYAAYEAILVKYADIGCRKPRGQVQYTGITEH